MAETINLQVVATDAGLSKVLSAQDAGIKLSISKIALGDGAYTLQSARARTSLQHEVVRVPIASSRKNDTTRQLDIAAAAQGEEEFWVREVGFLDEDGTLIFVWSDPTRALGYKSAPARFLLGLSMIVTEVPIGGIQIVDQGQPLELYIGNIEADLSGEHAVGGSHHYPLTNWIERDWNNEANLWEYHAEIMRGIGQSGIFLARCYNRAGTEAFNRPFDGSYSAINLHDHPNYPGMPGLGELSAVLNGYYLRTRHNDYRLNATTGGAYLATAPIQPPAVPASVTAAGSVAAQAAEMRAYFQALVTSDHTLRDYRPHFRWTLSVLELWPELLDGDALADTFDSFRHAEDTASLRLQMLKTLRLNSAGHKGRFENVSFIPASLRQVFSSGKPQWIVWRFRIVAADVGSVGDYPIDQLLTAVDRPGERWHFNYTPDQLKASRAARFRINTQLSTDPTFGSAASYDLLDELMAKVAGFDGPAANLSESYMDDGQLVTLTQYGTANQLNAGRYSRRYSAVADASNRSSAMRGYNDPSLFVARTTHQQVAGFDDAGQSYRFTYAIPLELVLRTPLESWDPYAIPTVAAVTGDGNTAATAYSGQRAEAYHYRVPAEFFAGDAPAPDPADTGGSTKYVKDAGGVARLVRGSGIRAILPAIDGVGNLRIRHPVYPLFWEGGHAQSMISALAGEVSQLVIPALTRQQQHDDSLSSQAERIRVLEARLQHLTSGD